MLKLSRKEKYAILAGASILTGVAAVKLSVQAHTGGGGIPYGTGWGTRIFRIRFDGTNLSEAQNILGQMPPMDHANRFTDGVPDMFGNPSASVYISAINGIMPLLRTNGTDHAVSHRLDYAQYASCGKNIKNLIASAGQIYSEVYSKTSPPQGAISIDNTGTLGNGAPTKNCPTGYYLTQADIDNVSTALYSQGWKYISWGANANPAALDQANFAMMATDPVALSVGNFSNYVSAGYKSISSHVDEPNNFGTFLQTFGSATDSTKIENAFTMIFQNQKIPATCQLLQGTLYNVLNQTASYKGLNYVYPPLSFFGNLVNTYNP